MALFPTSTRNDVIELYRAAIKRWGADAQMDMMVEECAEWTKARSKFRRTSDQSTADDLFEKRRLEDLIEETADVLIMADQMRVLLGEKQVDAVISQKLSRLAERMGPGGAPVGRTDVTDPNPGTGA